MSKKNILFAGAERSSGEENLQTERQFNEINRVLASKNYSLLKIRHPNIDQLLRELRDRRISIFVFNGHASENGLQWLNNSGRPERRLSYDNFINIIRKYQEEAHEEPPFLECAMLLGCDSDKICKDLSEYIFCVVGATREISPDESLSFARNFYEELSTQNTSEQERYEKALQYAQTNLTKDLYKDWLYSNINKSLKYQILTADQKNNKTLSIKSQEAKHDYSEYLNQILEYLPKIVASENSFLGLSEFDIDNDYIPRNLLKANESTNPKQAEQAFRDIVDEHKQFVVLSSGGMGKSTLTRWYACHLARRALKQTNQPIPVYIELNRYKGDLLALLADELDVDISLIKIGVKSGRFLILLDGFNEIDGNYRKIAIQEIKSVIYKNQKVGFIMTSRPNFGASELPLEKFSLSPLDSEEIIRHINRSVSLEIIELARNPLNLRIIISNPHILDENKINQAKLIESLIKNNFRWENQLSKNIENFDHSFVFESCLEAFAYCLTLQEKSSILIQEFGGKISDELEQLHLQNVSWLSIYEVLKMSRFLHTESGKVKFSLEIIQDYFCARRLVKHQDDFNKYIKNPQFTNPTTLALEIIGSADGLIGSLVSISSDVYHSLFHSSGIELEYDLLIDLLSHPNSIIIAAVTKKIVAIKKSEVGFFNNDLFDFVFRMNKDCQRACIHELIYARIPELLQPLIFLLGKEQVDLSSRKLILSWNSHLISRAVKDKLLKRQLFEWIVSPKFNSLRTDLINALCSESDSHENLIHIIKDSNVENHIRTNCASKLAWHCQVVKTETETNHTLLELLEDPTIPDEIRVAIAVEIDPDGEHLDSSLQELLNEELSIKLEDEYWDDLEEYRAGEELKSYHSSEHSWEFASYDPAFSTEMLISQVERLLDGDTYDEHPPCRGYSSLPFWDSLNAIAHYSDKSEVYADNYKVVIALSKLYQFVSENEDELSIWITPDDVFQTLVEVSSKMCTLETP